MKIVGLTGQTGAGKTTISSIFEEKGFYVIDCDQVSRQVTKDGSDCCKALANHFPEHFRQGYSLDRQSMARDVFSSRERLELLNKLIYPFITEEINLRISQVSGRCQYILLDAPTLFEARVDKLCCLTIAVVAAENIRLERIIRRDGLDPELAKKRSRSQHETEFFRQHCDYIIDNSDDLDSALRQTEEIIRRIKDD